MTLDRKDYKSAIPQLEKRLSEVEKIGKDAFNKFEDIAHKTQLDAAEAEKKVLSLDYKMTTTRVQMEYQLQTTGLDPVEANWQTTMPSITYNSYQGKTLWYRSKTYVNDIIVQTTEPMTVNLMDGVYSFVNSVSGNTGWTTIDGDKIQTGMITSNNGYCYFDIDNDEFQMKDNSTLASSTSALAWDNGQLYIKGKIAIGTSPADQARYTEMTSDGFEIVKDDVSVAQFGETARIGALDGYHSTIDGESFIIEDADGDTSFGITATGQTRSRKVRTTHIGARHDETTSSSEPTYTTILYTRDFYLGKPDTTYTISIHGDTEQTYTASFTPTSLSGLNTLTGSDKIVTYTAAQLTTQSTWTFSRGQIRRKKVDGHTVFAGVWMRVVIKTKTWARVPSGVNRWRCASPQMDVTYQSTVSVANTIINGDEYNLETLFGTDTDTLSLGKYVGTGVLSSNCGTLTFSIPTGRVFPNDVVINRITFGMVARAGNSEGAGIYIVKSASGGTSAAALDSSASSTLYNGNNQQKTLLATNWSWSLQGRSNLFVKFTTEDDFFSGTTTIRGQINNQPTALYFNNITLYLSFASKGDDDPDE